MNLIKCSLLTILMLVTPALMASNSQKHIIVGVEEIDYYPIYHVEQGNYQGYARDLFDAFAKSAGLTVEYRPLPINRLYSSLLKETIDVKFPDNALWQADLKGEANVLYSVPIIKYTDGVLVLKDAPKITSENFTKLGTVRGFTPWIFLDQVEAGSIKITETNKLASLLKLLEAGRIDGAYFNVLVAKQYAERELKGKLELHFADHLKHSSDAYHASSVSAPWVIDALNRFIKENPDTIEALKQKYQL